MKLSQFYPTCLTGTDVAYTVLQETMFVNEVANTDVRCSSVPCRAEIELKVILYRMLTL